MKGQSSIEYLNTYGWMLLAVAAVSGALIASSSQACETGASGFPYGAVQLADFGYSQGSMDILVENNDPQRMDQMLTGVILEHPETGKELRITDLNTVGYGERETLELPNMTRTKDCNNFNLKIQYERGTTVRSQSIAGQIEANLRINGTHMEPYAGPFSNFQTRITEMPSSVVINEDFTVTAEVENTGTLEETQVIDTNFTGATKTESLTLGYGDTETFSKDLTAPGTSGIYPVYVKSENDTSVEYLEVLTSEPDQLTVDIRDHDGTNFEKTADVELIQSGSVLDTQSVSDGEAAFEVNGGDYTINLSNPEYFETSTDVTVNSDTTISPEMHKIPQINTFDVTDNSECVQTVGWGFCNDYDVKYAVDWDVTDPNGHGVEANITYDGSEVFTGFTGMDNIQRDNGYGENHTIRLQAGYGHHSLCAEYEDNADGTDPASYSTC